MPDKNPFANGENPFAASIEPAYGTKSPMPAGLIVISIICLILAFCGLCGTAINVVSLLASDRLAMMMPAESRENYIAALELQKFPMIISVFLGLTASLLLTCGSGGTLAKKKWARKFFSWGLVGHAIGCGLTTLFSIYTLLFNAEQMIQLQSPQLGENTATQFFYAGQIVGLIMFAAFLAFYVFAYFYLKRKNVDAFFEQLPS